MSEARSSRRPAPIAAGEPSPESPAPPRGFALFALGFRPFYVLGALYAAVCMLGWMRVQEGGGWAGALNPLSWHQHEMVFGFALAVMAGFLLTAGRVWTGLATPQGWPLALLAGQWLLARVLAFTGPLAAAAAVDVAFSFVLAAVLWRVIVASRNRRNYFAIAVLAALGLANAGFYLEALGAGWPPAASSVRAALYLVVIMVIVVGGRVVPSFTANAFPRAGVVVTSPRLDYAALGFTLAAFLAALAAAPAWLLAPCAGIAALLHALRQWRWVPFATLGRPILWIMHLSYAWIALGLALLALEALGELPAAASLHAFGAGAIGGMIIAMITRTALGHTGRALSVGAWETTAYALVQLAALARLAASLVPVGLYEPLVMTAGHLWAAAFLVYFVQYLPRLVRPRLDGKPG